MATTGEKRAAETISTVFGLAGAVAVVVSAVNWALPIFMRLNVPPEVLQTLCALGVAFWLVAAWLLRRVGNTSAWTNVWAALRNDVPPVSRQVEKHPRVGLLHCGGAATQIVAQIKGLPGCVFIDLDVIAGSRTTFDTELPHCDAILVLYGVEWTAPQAQATIGKESALKEIAAWSARNSEKPVLVVTYDDTAPLPELEQFVKAHARTADDAVDKLGGLLSRAVTRAGLWKNQAGYLYWACFVLFLFGAFVFWRAQQSAPKIERLTRNDGLELSRVATATRSIRKLLTDAMRDGRLQDPRTQKKELQDAMGTLGTALAGRVGENRKGGGFPRSVSFWVKVTLDESHACVCDAVPDGGKGSSPVCFTTDDKAIVACAMRNNWIVTWAKPASVSAHSIDGEEIPSSQAGEECHYHSFPRNDQRDHLICLAVGWTAEERGGFDANGACLSTSGVDGLDEDIVRRHLVAATSTLASLPLSAFTVDDEVRAACAGKFEGRGVPPPPAPVATTAATPSAPAPPPSSATTKSSPVHP